MRTFKRIARNNADLLSKRDTLALVDEIIEACNGNVSKACELIGIERRTYYNWKERKDIKNIKNFKEDKEKNLDFLAKKYYNNVEYWWVIAIYNDIIDPFDFEKEIIRIPDINEVENIYMDYKIQEGLS